MNTHSKGSSAALFALMALGVSAAPAAGQTEVGLRAGVNFADVSGEDVGSTTGRRTGLLVGGFLQFPFSGIIDLQLGAQYSQKGFEVEAPGSDAEFEFKADYIEVPVLAVFNIEGDSPIGVHLALGPAFAFKVGCEGTLSGGGGSISGECENEEGEDAGLKSFDFGAIFGGGVHIGMGSAKLFGDFHLNMGLLDIFEDEGAGDADEDAVRNDVYSVSAGIAFPLGD